MARRIGLVLTVAALAAWGNAQPGQVGGPVIGYVFDGSAHAVRPVLGIPGAALFGSSVTLGYDVASASISPAGDSAVVMAADGSLHLIGLSGGAAAEISLNGAMRKPDRVVFSPSGTALALITNGRVQILSGLPATATLAATMDLGTAASTQASAQGGKRPATVFGSMALSDDGALLLFVANGTVHLAGAGGPHSFDTAGRETVVAFAPAGHDAVLATKTGVNLLRSIDSTATPEPLAPAAPLDNIAGAAFSTDGKTLFLAGGQGITAFDLSTGAPTAIVSDTIPTVLERMGGVYRLNDLGSGPLWVLDPAPGHQRVVFVPAAGGSE
ncbi:MAG TPA: hypothetical protein VKB88_27130 [Bryobacteraceae bacterium]|nr:hypothetical protein [Bryobacteraceae bacterium]